MASLVRAFVVVILNSVVVLQVNAAFREECPHPEDVYPCYCEEEETSPEIHCNHLTTEDQLVQGLKTLKDYKVWKLSFWKSEIPIVKSNAFQGLSVQRINFENSSTKLEAPQFIGLDQSLVFLQFSNCFNRTYPMPNWSLGHLEKLGEFNFYSNSISSLEDDWLASVHDKLMTLMLSENGIETLGDKAFAKVKGLTYLYLELNKLTTIKRSMFPSPARYLRTINLSRNKIESLPIDAFKDMPFLRTLDLEGNAITIVDETTYSPIIKQLGTLNLSGNPIRCDFSLKWMYAIGSSRPSLLYGTCDSPKSLKGRTLDSLSRIDFT